MPTALKPFISITQARGIAPGETVIDTTDNDKQESTSSVFKGDGREGAGVISVLLSASSGLALYTLYRH